MKNNLILKFSLFFMFFLNFLNASSEELKFEASSIEIIDRDKIVIAEDGVKIFEGMTLHFQGAPRRIEQDSAA